MDSAVRVLKLTPKIKGKRSSVRCSRLRSDSENIAPIDPNIQLGNSPLSLSILFSKILPSEVRVDPRTGELTALIVQGNVGEVPDPPVKVVVRIRPADGLGIGDTFVGQVSKDSLSVIGKGNYIYHSVLDIGSTQGDAYQLVGVRMHYLVTIHQFWLMDRRAMVRRTQCGDPRVPWLRVHIVIFMALCHAFFRILSQRFRRRKAYLMKGIYRSLRLLGGCMAWRGKLMGMSRERMMPMKTMTRRQVRESRLLRRMETLWMKKRLMMRFWRVHELLWDDDP